jgi:hypothetical protein
MTQGNERRLTVLDEATDFLLYTAPDGQVKVECVLRDETIWLTQDRIAELFGVQRPAITKHLKNIFESGELEEKVVGSILEHTTQHGAIDGKTQTRAVKFYNLDAIISVGYGSISRKQAEEKAFAEYEKFDKTQRIESDFDKMVKRLPSVSDIQPPAAPASI